MLVESCEELSVSTYFVKLYKSNRGRNALELSKPLRQIRNPTVESRFSGYTCRTYLELLSLIFMILSPHLNEQINARIEEQKLGLAVRESVVEWLIMWTVKPPVVSLMCRPTIIILTVFWMGL